MSQRHLARATAVAVAVAAAAAFLLVLCFSNHPQALERGEEGSASPHGTALHAGTVWRWRGVQRAGCCCVRRQAHRAGERSGGPGTVTMPPAWEEEVGQRAGVVEMGRMEAERLEPCAGIQGEGGSGRW